jgi:hypothetical protein
VWKKIHKWLNDDMVHFEEVCSHFNGFGALVKYKKNAKGHHLIWLATTRSLWNVWNNIMFRVKVANVSILVDQIIFISWFWLIKKIENNSFFIL